MRRSFDAIRCCLLMAAFFVGLFVGLSPFVCAQGVDEEIDAFIRETLPQTKIPGVCLIVVREDSVSVKNYGYADLESKSPVTDKTLFELASCSKSFTALAVLKLKQEKLLTLDDPVSKFFPWFKTYYKGKETVITINHLLHHTSGIPTQAFGKIPLGAHARALEDEVRRISGTQLAEAPGRTFIYANTNYDIAGAVIEQVSGMAFEAYMGKNIFHLLDMPDTSVGTVSERGTKATGYKISFNEPRPFRSPVFRGNFPAGYVMTNGSDMAQWLKAQLDLKETVFAHLIKEAQTPNLTMQAGGFRRMLYSMGWLIPGSNRGTLFHGGLNPNFTSFVMVDTKKKIAFALLANADSSGTEYLAMQLNRLLTKEKGTEFKPEEYTYTAGIDGACTAAGYGMWVLLLICAGIVIYILIDALRGVRKVTGPSFKKMMHIGIALLGTAPLVLSIYFLPDAAMGFSWAAALAWAPQSFPALVRLVLVFLGAANVIFLLSLFLPYKDKGSFRNQYLRPLPMILFLGFVSGLAGAATMFLISTSFFSPMPMQYLVYFIGASLFISVLGQKVVRTRMMVIANDIVYELRMNLTTKIFSTRYQMFEKIDSGRVYSTLNNDTESIANSASMVVGTVSSLVTAIAAFVYLSAISLTATLSTLFFALLLGGFYILVGKKARVLMEKMRDTQDVFMKLIEGLVKGFREISMHHNKKVQYDADVEKACAEYRETRVSAFVRFINANLFSSSMIMTLLAVICISFPRIFPELSLARLISFIMVLLYMIGPVTSIMSSFPTFIRIKVSWDRIRTFIDEIPAMPELTSYKEIAALSHKGERVGCIEAKGVTYTYAGEEGAQDFVVGPIDLKVKSGEILFIVGGNGSGKTTLAKLITGLYQPEKGDVTIDGKKIEGNDYLGEYFSIIFDNFMLFEKLYNVDLEEKKEEIAKYLKVLRLDKKVKLEEGKFSTINLSSGQRKRLALLQCYLEDCPIYLFDEVAADQDPEFRKFFYRDLLMEMKAAGKIIIAITHDDHYFDIADQIIKLDMGRIDQDVSILPVR